MEPITPALRKGARLFNEEEFFEAHEVWEDEWHEAVGTNKTFLHGLIQTAAAYVHHKRGNPQGVLSLSNSALIYLKKVPSYYRGVDVKHVRNINREAKERAERSIKEEKELVLRKYTIEVEENKEEEQKK
ncbi:MAG: DUF309 domain-containing protein [Halobacteria archaeon]|nr:DUF309 domain-containing protein [Halobacteria archaeon]